MGKRVRRDALIESIMDEKCPWEWTMGESCRKSCTQHVCQYSLYVVLFFCFSWRSFCRDCLCLLVRIEVIRIPRGGRVLSGGAYVETI